MSGSISLRLAKVFVDGIGSVTVSVKAEFDQEAGGTVILADGFENQDDGAEARAYVRDLLVRDLTY